MNYFNLALPTCKCYIFCQQDRHHEDGLSHYNSNTWKPLKYFWVETVLQTKIQISCFIFEKYKKLTGNDI